MPSELIDSSSDVCTCLAFGPASSFLPAQQAVPHLPVSSCDQQFTVLMSYHIHLTHGLPSSLVLHVPASVLAAAAMPATGWWRVLAQSLRVRVTHSPNSMVVQRLLTFALETLCRIISEAGHRVEIHTKRRLGSSHDGFTTNWLPAGPFEFALAPNMALH